MDNTSHDVIVTRIFLAIFSSIPAFERSIEVVVMVMSIETHVASGFPTMIKGF